jgi:hypothetical protein
MIRKRTHRAHIVREARVNVQRVVDSIIAHDGNLKQVAQEHGWDDLSALRLVGWQRILMELGNRLAETMRRVGMMEVEGPAWNQRERGADIEGKYIGPDREMVPEPDMWLTAKLRVSGGGNQLEFVHVDLVKTGIYRMTLTSRVRLHRFERDLRRSMRLRIPVEHEMEDDEG